MRRIQSRMPSMSAALAAIAVTFSPARALAAEPGTQHPQARVAAVLSRQSREVDDPGLHGSVTRTSGSDDGGGSDDSVTTRTSRMKPVGGVGPLMGGGSNRSSRMPKTQHHPSHPRTRTSGANGGGDD
jgi:hypothetical protein